MKFFKPEDFEPAFDFYGVSKIGEVCNFKTGRLLKITPINSGYLTVKLRTNKQSKSWLVHRLVAHVFLGPCPEGLQVNHKDGNKHNNSIENLEYVTQRQNISHARITGLMPKVTNRKLTDQQVQDIKTILDIRKRCNSIFPKHEHIAAMFRISHSMVDHIEKGKHWND